MLNLLTLDKNNKVTNWIFTGISLKRIKPFDSSLASIMSHIANGRVKKINNSVLGQTVLLYCIVTSF